LNLVGIDLGMAALTQLDENTFRFYGSGSVAEYVGKYDISYLPEE